MTRMPSILDFPQSGVQIQMPKETLNWASLYLHMAQYIFAPFSWSAPHYTSPPFFLLQDLNILGISSSSLIPA